MSEAIQPVEYHGTYREESKLEESTFSDPDAEATDQIVQEPLNMDMVQQILNNITTRMADNHKQLSEQIGILAQAITRLPDLVKQEVGNQQRPGPVGDPDAFEDIRDDLRVHGDIMRSFEQRLGSMESSDQHQYPVLLAEIRDSQQVQ